MTFEEFKENFLPEFLNIKSFAGKIKYAGQYLTRIGSGTGRIVYDIDGQKVLKLAKNTKGVAQNSAEADIGHYNDAQNIVTIVYDNYDDYSWLISEKAKKVTEKRIVQLTGIPSLNELYQYVRNFEQSNRGRGNLFGQKQEIVEQLNENEFAQELTEFIANYGQLAGDMGRPSSYGEVLRDGQPSIVLTDYGLNDEVYDTYYSPQRKQKYHMYELYNFADGNDDILSDIGNVGQDQRHGMWGLIPYGVGDGDGVINEEFKEFIIKRSIYPNKPINNMPQLVDNFHECVNNLKETLGQVKDKKTFYNNLLALQNYLISQNYYDREPLSIINENIEQQSPKVQGYTLTDRNYATDIAKEFTEKLGINTLKFLGSGSNGFAFDIGDTKIFKLSTDISEADAASKLMRVKPIHIAIVYNLYKIVDTEKNLSFFGIIERHITDKPIEKFNHYVDVINKIKPNNMNAVNFYVMMKKKFNYNDIILLAKNILTENTEVNISDIERQQTYNWLIGLFEIKKELLSYSIKSDDYTNLENLGYEDNILKFFDIGGYFGITEPQVNDINTVFLPENEQIFNEDYNRSLADTIANKIVNVKGYNKPTFLGSGQFGVAYDIGDDKVLKITKDNSEAAENLSLIGKPLKYIAQPYNVFTINSENDNKIPKTYAIVLEKLKTDPQEFKRLFDRMDFAFEKIMNVRFSDVLEYYLYGLRYHSNVDKKTVENYFSKNSQDEEFFYSILRIAEEVEKYGIESKDYYNPDNLGYKKSGAIAFFDVGFGNGFLQPNNAENLTVNEDGSSKFSAINSIGQDNFPPYETNDTSPVTDNNIPTTPEDVKEDLEYHHVVSDATNDKFSVDERTKSFMPNSQSVEVKKKCRLGGNGGTSTACNQGDINNLNLKSIDETYLPNETFWAWVSPDDQFYKVQRLNHKGFIMRIYKDKDFGWDYDRVFDVAMKDGWVRVVFEKLDRDYRGELSLYGYSKDRVKQVFKNMFFDLIKYGNNIIYLDYVDGGKGDILRTNDAEGKAKLINYINEQSINEEIDASDAYRDEDAIKKMIEGKKDVAILSFKINPELREMANNNNFGLIKINQDHHDIDMHIVYRQTPRGKANAEKLNQIMISHGGYVSDQTPEEAYEIGKLLDYNDKSIEEYINRRYHKAPNDKIYPDLVNVNEVDKPHIKYAKENDELKQKQDEVYKKIDELANEIKKKYFSKYLTPNDLQSILNQTTGWFPKQVEVFKKMSDIDNNNYTAEVNKLKNLLEKSQKYFLFQKVQIDKRNKNNNQYGFKGDINSRYLYHITTTNSARSIIFDGHIMGGGESNGVSTTTNINLVKQIQPIFYHPTEDSEGTTYKNLSTNFVLDFNKIKADNIKFKTGSDDELIGTHFGEEEIKLYPPNEELDLFKYLIKIIYDPSKEKNEDTKNKFIKLLKEKNIPFFIKNNNKNLNEQSMKDFEKQIEKDNKDDGLDKLLLFEEDDYKVYAINGKYVRSKNPGLNFDEWVDGGHHYVDLDLPKKEQKYAKHIPEDEIWVDDVFIIKPDDLGAILLHETLERHLMKYYGLKYSNDGEGKDGAHEIANKAEVEFRERVKNGFGRDVSEEIYTKFVKNYTKEHPEKKLKINEENYVGKAYRVNSNFIQSKGTTAGDVVRFEMKELGNVDDFNITPEKLKELDKYPAKDIVWITKTFEDAKRYSNEDDFSDIDEFDINNGEIIGEDGDGGYLILIKKHNLNESIMIEDDSQSNNKITGFVNNLKQKPFIQSLINDLKSDVYVVGGAVRDLILNKPNKDIDLVIGKTDIDYLINHLQKFGKVDVVGKSFGVIKFVDNDGTDYDLALPRKEKSNGEGGYRGFEVQSDKNIPIEDELIRRDARFNAMAININTGKFIDPLGGLEDIKKKQISAANPDAFSDDPLRMLRMIGFASRFGFTIESQTMQMIKDNASRIKEISPERILIEFDKIIHKGVIRIGVQQLKDSGLFEQIFGFDLKQLTIDRSPFEEVKTMGEFIYLLTQLLPNPAEFYKNNLKGDLDTYKEIKALQMAFEGGEATNLIEARSIAHNMYITSQQSFQSQILPNVIEIAIQELLNGKYPKTIGELAINGNDLIQLGLKGKEIGDTLKSLLLKIYANSVKNNRDDLLNILNQNNKSLKQEGVADKYAEKEFNIPNSNTEMDVKAMGDIQKNEEKPYATGRVGGEKIVIFKNPKTLNNFGNNVRAIADNDGNLFVAQKNGDFVHGEMAYVLGFSNSYDGVYDTEEKYQFLHRVDYTNKFGLGDTSTNFVKRGNNGYEISLRILEKTKRKNPQYDFYIEYYNNITDDNNYKPIDINENKEGESRIEYGCLMLYLDIPIWNKITSIIKKDDIYDKEGFGIEKFSHLTLLYGFHDEVTSNDVFELYKENIPLKPIEVHVSGISIFENPEFDVVKFDVNSKLLENINKLMQELPNTKTFPEYHAHITIAYVKKGEGKKYIKPFEKERTFKGNELVFTYKEHKGNDGEKLMLDKKGLLNEEYNELYDSKYKLNNEIMDINFFIKKYNEWNNQNGKPSYGDPSEASVLEFLQNNYEDFSYNEKLKHKLLWKLTDNDVLNEEVTINNDFFYHITPKKNVENILKYGLLPEYSIHSKREKAIYLTNDKFTAENYSNMFDEPTVLLNIDSKFLNEKYFRPDDYELIVYLRSQYEGQKYKNWYDVPWQLSLKWTNQVKYVNEIPKEAISVDKKQWSINETNDNNETIDINGKKISLNYIKQNWNNTNIKYTNNNFYKNIYNRAILSRKLTPKQWWYLDFLFKNGKSPYEANVLLKNI